MLQSRTFPLLFAVVLGISSVNGFTLTGPRLHRTSMSSPRNYDVTGVDHSIQKAAGAAASAWFPLTNTDQGALSVSTFQPLTTATTSNPLQPALSLTKGVVLTTVHTSTSAVTGALVRNTVKRVLTIVPTSLRLFFQPLLILYFVPLFLVRYWTGPNRKQARRDHDLFITRVRSSMESTDRLGSDNNYWPAHA